MSTELEPVAGDSSETEVSVTSFNGGRRGLCLQLTQGEQFVHLTRDQVASMVERMTEWLDDDTST